MVSLRRFAHRLGGALTVVGVVALTLAAPTTDTVLSRSTGATARAVDASRGYDGVCRAEDSAGVTVVVDFGSLDGNAERPAPTLTRCSPAPNNDAKVRRTGLQALVDAGIMVSGTKRWGDEYPANVGFACRVEGRPALDELLLIDSSQSSYTEPCLDTPPSEAYWAYWHADGSGKPWGYSEFGLMNRYVQPGGFEGWSFSLDATSADGQFQNPPPEVTPLNPHRGPGAAPLPTPGAPPTQTPTAPTALAPPSSGSPGSPGKPGTAIAAGAALRSAGWLVGELDPIGEMPGPYAGTDWGLTLDAQWALYAAGTGKRTVADISRSLAPHVGEYLGADLFEDPAARIGGSVAKLLVAAVVAGDDPTAFGTGRYLPAGTTYDLRAEALALLEPDGAQTGRLSNVGTGKDETNVFAQALVVIGLARSGGVPEEAVEFLVSQQCTDGWFRMFYNDGLSCVAATDAVADIDGTAMALQALLTARDNGTPGLDGHVEQAAQWLLSAQRKDGSYGGGVATAGSNSNSTGLAAAALWAAAQTADPTSAKRLTTGYERAREWVLNLQARDETARGTALRSEYGAIAYNPDAFSTSRSTGIGASERDQWRRATTQAVLALAPVSFARLGTDEPVDEPAANPSQGTPTRDESSNAARPTPGRGPGARSTPAGSGGTPVLTLAAINQDRSAAGRMATYLTRRLVDGDHAETRVDGTAYVDYDVTVDILLALRALDRQPTAVRRITDFLLHPRSVATYGHGRDQEPAAAAYAEPLNRLLVVARFAQHDRPRADRPRDLIRELSADLAALDTAEGPVDTGTFATDPRSTGALAWALVGTSARTVATTPSESTVATWTQRLLSAQCDEGSFTAALDEPQGCLSGGTGREDAARTLSATRALATLPDADESVRRARWRSQSVGADQLTVADLLADTETDISAVTSALALRQLAGLETTSETTVLAGLVLKQGGLPARVDGERPDPRVSLAAATAIAGRDWTSAVGSPAVPVPTDPSVLTAAAESPAPAAAPPTGHLDRLVFLAIGLVLGLLACLPAHLFRRRRVVTTLKESHV